jgi:hypothetical protein
MMAKPELEFFDTETIPWKPVDGSPGKYEKILSQDPETGAYTRLLLSEPDLHLAVQNFKNPPYKVLCHDDMWEEVYVVRGTLIDVSLNQTFSAGYYACRPPGMNHGPFYHPTGAISLEFRTPIKK